MVFKTHTVEAQSRGDLCVQQYLSDVGEKHLSVRDKQEGLPGSKIRVHQAMYADTCTAGKVSWRREDLNVMEASSESRWYQIMEGGENLSVTLGLVQ